MTVSGNSDSIGESAPDAGGVIGFATARAPGVCGVLAQGVLGEMPFSVTCPVDFFSRVRVELSGGGPGVTVTEGCEKTAAAVRRTLSHLRQAKVRADVRVSSPIPRGRGLGSSSADLSAAIAATALALGEELSPYDIAQIALSIEPTGGVMMPGLALFDHRAGMVRQSIGPPPPMEIVALDFGGASRSDLGGNSQQWRLVDALTEEALSLIRRGVADKSPALVGQGATMLLRPPAVFRPGPGWKRWPSSPVKSAPPASPAGRTRASPACCSTPPSVAASQPTLRPGSPFPMPKPYITSGCSAEVSRPSPQG